MAYIWSNYSKEKKYRVVTSHVSPYLEVWDNLEDTVLVNIFIRLFETLVVYNDSSSLSLEEKVNKLLDLYENNERYEDIVNSLLHYLAQTDLYKGLTKLDFWTYNIYCAIKQGDYGDSNKELFLKLTGKDKLILCQYIAKFDISGGRETQLDSVLRALFSEVQIYYEKSTGIVHIYIDEERNSYNDNLFDMVCRFFKDIYLECRVYWRDEHFGIIEIEETMCVDRLVLI